MCDGHTPQLVPDLIDLTPGWCWRQSINVEQGRFRGMASGRMKIISRRGGQEQWASSQRRVDARPRIQSVNRVLPLTLTPEKPYWFSVERIGLLCGAWSVRLRHPANVLRSYSLPIGSKERPCDVRLLTETGDEILRATGIADLHDSHYW